MNSINQPPWDGLQARLKGRISWKDADRIAYQSDASMYAQKPAAVLQPAHSEDVQAALAFCRHHHISLTPRGAGTSTAGQAIGEGLVIDFSVFMNQILEINAEDKTAIVQPGMVYQQFNEQCCSENLWFPVNPSSGKVCTLGGMIGNNASGPNSFSYGAMRENVLALKILMADGSIVDTEKPPPLLKEKLTSLLLPEQHRIQKHFPKTRVNASGYNLNHAFDDEQNIQLTQLIMGSEGTLGLILEAKIQLYPKPKTEMAALLGFSCTQKASDALLLLRSLKPRALEWIDDIILEIFRQKGHLNAPNDLQAMLVMEVESLKPAAATELKKQLEKANDLTKHLGCYFKILENPAHIQGWRKDVSPLLHQLKGGIKPLKFIEDAAVMPENLGRYIEGLKQIFRKHETRGAMFGHAGNAHIHVNPQINPRLPQGKQKWQDIFDEQTQLVLDLKGTVSGEHGDGILRTQAVEKQFAPLIPLFKELQHVLDPNRIFNPGKIINIGNTQPTNHWRYEKPWHLTSKDEYFEHLDICHGCGKCRSYCPEILESRQEIHSPRARIEFTRAALSQPSLLEDPYFDQRLEACKACSLCEEHCPNHIAVANLLSQARKAIFPR